MKRIPIPVTLEKDGEKHEFPSMADAGRFLGCQAGQIHVHSKMKSSTYKGWKISLLGETTKRSDLECKVFIFETNGKFLQECRSVHECARLLEKNVKDIWAVLNNYGRGQGKGLFAGKYLLRYTKENDDTYDPADFA